MQKEKGSISYAGTIGAGMIGGSSGFANKDGGAGWGTRGGGGGDDDVIGYGPEFTVTFSSNPGILKTIELDTRQITNPGITDYWVADVRKGEFATRYPTNIGRVNTLLYGSKYLYTNVDHTKDVALNTLIKIGGQETRIDAAPESYVLTLADPFLGTSVLPILTDTEVTATGFTSADANVANSVTLTTLVAGQVTAATASKLYRGAKLFLNGCPFVSDGTNPDRGVIRENEEDMLIKLDNDCPLDLFTGALKLYARSDNRGNQNFYKTSGDVGVAASQGLCTSRGSSAMHTCEDTGLYVNAVMEADVRLDMFEETSKQFTTHEDIVGLTVNDTLYVNGVGPFTDFDEVVSRTFTVQTEAFEEFIGGGMTKWRLFRSTHNTDIGAGSILMMDGRRYKVRSVEDDAAGYNASQVSETVQYCHSVVTKGLVLLLQIVHACPDMPRVTCRSL
jgi:hypothetical protein